MATGDIKNNLKMLSAELRSVKTPPGLVNLEGMMPGDPNVYLPIYDYLFQWHSTRLANEILRKDLKLPPYKHNRTKFLETMYLIDTLLHHLMEVQSSVKALKEQMLLVMNQTETMLDQVLPVVTEIVDELYKKEAADVPPINNEQKHELDKGDSALQESRVASGAAEAISARPKSEVLLD
ncbi:hypothetical protein HPB50_026509 [Hyalomma asiaticum]|uniref:Uncharacterized protein n=1 Tax=Hyalomma asiaticum TaxID=266040 RepID=A0ACB7SXE1_HYAAI|nr:hypothetical protein HPB50_026509 [Hyalomma asiaticum]